MTHFAALELPLQSASKSWARFSHAPNGSALIFVHGFNGRALDTWNEFPSRLCGRNSCCGSDLFFYGYDSLRTPVTVSSALLRQRFLQPMWKDSAAFGNAVLDPAAARSTGFQYNRVTIVAHSLGAIVSRQALADGLREQPSPDPWALNTSLILFAPAHKGASVMALAFECLMGLPYVGAIVSPLQPLLKFRYPVLQGLQPGSDALTTLEASVQKLVGTGHANISAKKVIWGEKDNIVNQIGFADDPPPLIMMGKTHVDVCKPCAGYLSPVEILEGCL